MLPIFAQRHNILSFDVKILSKVLNCFIKSREGERTVCVSVFCVEFSKKCLFVFTVRDERLIGFDASFSKRAQIYKN